MRRLFLLTLILLILPLSSAEIIISEIMYDPEGTDGGHEWIEIYNNDSNPIDLTGWKLYEAGTNHGLTLKQGSIILQPEEYAIIADKWDIFLDDYEYDGTLIDSSFSLSNTEETLALKDSSLEIIDQVTYSSSWGDTEGYSLSKIDPTSASNNSANWMESPYTDGSPGWDNFPQHKLIISDLVINPAKPMINQDVTATVEIKNVGLSDESIILTLDLDGEEEGSEAFELNFSDSEEIEFELTNLTLGNHTLQANVFSPSASDSETLDFEVAIPLPADVNMSVCLDVDDDDPDDRWFVFYIQPDDAIATAEITVTPKGYDDLLIDLYEHEFDGIANPYDFGNIYDYDFIDFGSYTFCANITFTQNYNDTTPDNNYVCDNVTIPPKYSRHRTKIYIDDEIYNLSDAIDWVAEVFLPQDYNEVDGELIIDLRRGREKVILQEDENFELNQESVMLNGTYQVENDSLAGIYKLRAKLKYEDTYIESSDDGAFYLEGLEDLGNPSLSVLSNPASTRFGDYAIVPIKLSTNNLNSKIRLIAYPDKPEHVAMDLKGNTIYQKYCEIDTAVEIDVNRAQTIYAELPIFLKQNCDSKLQETTYTSYVRACEWTGSEWEYTDLKEAFSLSVSGNNDNYCPASSSRSSGGSALPIIPKKEEEESSALMQILSAPEEIRIQEPLQTQVKLTNAGNETEVLEVYSYIYAGQNCISEGKINDWKKGWTANQQSVTIPPKSSVTLDLANRIKQDAEAGDYTLKVKVTGGTKEIESTKTIKVLDEIYISEGEYEPASSSAASAITGKAVYVSESSSKARTIVYLVLFISIILNIIMIKASR